MLVFVSGIELEPIQVSPIYVKDIHFDIILSDTIETIESQIMRHLGHDINLIKIGKEIELIIGIDDAQIQHRTWTFSIGPNIGILKVFMVNAQINSLHVDMNIKHVILEQKIPQLYDTITKCGIYPGRVGNGGVVYRKICNDEYIARSPNIDEINLIGNALIKKANDAIFLISH